MASELTVTNSIRIDASVSRIWEVLTRPELTRQYMFGCDAVSDWVVGSPLLWRGAADGVVYVKGIVVDITPGRLLRFSVFDPNSGLEDIPENYLFVTYELIPGDGQTLLTIIQGDFAKVANGEKRYADTLAHWDTVVLALKEVAEK